jgi:hypothetical protein
MAEIALRERDLKCPVSEALFSSPPNMLGGEEKRVAETGLAPTVSQVTIRPPCRRSSWQLELSLRLSRESKAGPGIGRR